MTSPTLPQIVEGLSEAQKQLIRDAWYGRGGWRIEHSSPRLFALGITHGSSSRLTALGMEVRTHLLSLGEGV